MIGISVMEELNNYEVLQSKEWYITIIWVQNVFQLPHEFSQIKK